MAKPYRYWFSLHHDTKAPIGGVKQVHRVAEAFVKLGRKASIIQEDESFHPGWFDSDIEPISLEKFKNKTDCWCDQSKLRPMEIPRVCWRERIRSWN